MTSSIHDPRYKLLREELAIMRKAAALTQAELGDLLGVGQSYVSKVERGENYVDSLLLVDWCIACGVRPAAVMEQVADYKHPRLSLKR